MDKYCSINLYKLIKDNCFNIPVELTFDNETGYTKSAISYHDINMFLQNQNIYLVPEIYGDYSTDADGNIVDKWTFWSFSIYSIIDGSLIYKEDEIEYDSYMDALESGIEYCLTNLF